MGKKADKPFKPKKSNRTEQILKGQKWKNHPTKAIKFGWVEITTWKLPKAIKIMVTEFKGYNLIPMREKEIESYQGNFIKEYKWEL